MSRLRRSAAEGLGTAFLLAAVVGSGIMGERLAGGKVALALLANTAATGAALVVLILTFGPISGAHLNPAVTLAEAWQGGLPWRDVPAYWAAQAIGAVVGVGVAHLMFGEPLYAVLSPVPVPRAIQAPVLHPQREPEGEWQGSSSGIVLARRAGTSLPPRLGTPEFGARRMPASAVLDAGRVGRAVSRSSGSGLTLSAGLPGKRPRRDLCRLPAARGDVDAVVSTCEVVAMAGVGLSGFWKRLRCPRPMSPSSETTRQT
ncbi:MAG: aquaporin [Candidatus Rokuibacteriota bacterium]